MRILTYTVTPEEDGRMVKGILRGSLQLSYTLLKSLKWRENAILLNGQSVHVNTIVRAGDTVSVVLSERTPREDLYCANAAKPDIVYEDDDLLVLNKPAGVAMHPKSGDASAPSLAAMLTNYLGEGSVPHFVSRLDKVSSSPQRAATCTTACAARCTQAICGASTAPSPSAQSSRRAASSTRRSAARRAPSSAAACAWMDFRASQSTRLCK